LVKDKSSDKNIVFLLNQLRTAKEIALHGGHVTKKISDRNYRMLFDNKRFIEDKNSSETFLDSRPLMSVSEGRILREISKMSKVKSYSKNMYSNEFKSQYKNKLDLLVRNFLKALLNNDLNLDKNEFKNYNSLINFMKGYDEGLNISSNYLAQLKRRGNFVKIPFNNSYIKFIKHVKNTFPNFDYKGLFLNPYKVSLNNPL